MPIRVECPKCGRVTHYADNDAGLAASCISCKTVITVPKPQAMARPAPRVLRDPSQELHLPETPAVTPKPVETAPVQTRAPREPINFKPVLKVAAAILLLIGLVAAIVVYVNRPKRASEVAIAPSTQPTTAPAPKPAPTTVATVTPATQPAPINPPVLLSSVVEPPVKAVAAVLPQEPALPRGFLAVERVQFDGKLHADSYNSAQATYDDDHPGKNCIIACNGHIATNGRVEVKGDMRPGPNVGAKFREVKVSGSMLPLEKSLTIPPVKLDPFAADSANHALPEKFYRNGQLNLWGGVKVTLPGGTYYLERLVVDGAARLTFEGPATLYVHNQVSVSGRIKAFEDKPANLRIRMTGESTFVVNNDNELHLDLYAPQTRIVITGKGDIFGSMVGRSLQVSGSRNLHFDEALLPTR